MSDFGYSVAITSVRDLWPFILIRQLIFQLSPLLDCELFSGNFYKKVFLINYTIFDLKFFCCRYGRRPIFFFSLVVQVIAGISVGFAPDFYSYTLFRTIVGATTSGVFLVAYVIGKFK